MFLIPWERFSPSLYIEDGGGGTVSRVRGRSSPWLAVSRSAWPPHTVQGARRGAKRQASSPTRQTRLDLSALQRGWTTQKCGPSAAPVSRSARPARDATQPAMPSDLPQCALRARGIRRSARRRRTSLPSGGAAQERRPRGPSTRQPWLPSTRPAPEGCRPPRRRRSAHQAQRRGRDASAVGPVLRERSARGQFPEADDSVAIRRRGWCGRAAHRPPPSTASWAAMRTTAQPC